jgi:hypothetical protein
MIRWPWAWASAAPWPSAATLARSAAISAAWTSGAWRAIQVNSVGPTFQLIRA